ncbi:MAG: hypothetical protein ACI4SV_01280 [Duodenibacillus sp.]
MEVDVMKNRPGGAARAKLRLGEHVPDTEVRMENPKTIHETFSIQFSGKAFDNNEIPAYALAQSLLSLDGLAKRASEAVYGKESYAEIKVKAGFRQGSFIVDLIATCQNDPVAATAVLAGGTTVAGGVVAIVKGLVKLGKFAFGKKVNVDPAKVDGDTVTITNDIGQVNSFGVTVVNIYNQARTRSQLSRLTQTLDQEGADSIRIYTDVEDPTAEIIDKRDRGYFRHAEGVVLTDNEAEVILEVVGPMVNGVGKGWKFSEGGDGIEFTANVEDEDFLNKVKTREVKFENGTAVRAIVRTVQRKIIRTVTDRTIVEVKEVIPPSDEEGCCQTTLV